MVYYVGRVYRPSDDTWLLLDVLHERGPKGDLCIDLGAGSGILGIYALLNGFCKRVVFVDVMEDAVESARLNTVANKVHHVSVVALSDGVVGADESVDIVIANPPYLPAQDPSRIDVTVEGGVEGYETVLNFIDFAREVLRRGGVLYLVYSSLSRPEVILAYLEDRGMRVSYSKYKRFFYETIYAVECVKT